MKPKSDPPPIILQARPLDIRGAAVSGDRPELILNPTSGQPSAVAATEIIQTARERASRPPLGRRDDHEPACDLP